MGFSDAERAALLTAKGVGPTVVARLEQLGYGSLAQLADATPDDITRQVAAMLGTTCWRNSPQVKEAIVVVAVAQAQSSPKTSSKKSSIIR